MKPSSAGLLHMDWGTVFASIARDREGRAVLCSWRHSHAPIAADDLNAASVHNNWSAFLLVQARRKSGANARRFQSHARARNRSAGADKGAYNLACIAAEGEDWERCRSGAFARGPRFLRPRTDSVTSFDKFRAGRGSQPSEALNLRHASHHHRGRHRWLTASLCAGRASKLKYMAEVPSASGSKPRPTP
jgi:hypothetical protein